MAMLRQMTWATAAAPCSRSTDIATFVVLGLLQAVVTEPWQLLVVRLLLGVAVGAEYALGAALLSEFAPPDGRGRRLAGCS